jgi:hypothetical protein
VTSGITASASEGSRTARVFSVIPPTCKA